MSQPIGGTGRGGRPRRPILLAIRAAVQAALAGVYAVTANHGAGERLVRVRYPLGASAVWATGRTRDLDIRCGGGDLVKAFRALLPSLVDGRGQLDAGYSVHGLRVEFAGLAATERALQDLFALRYAALPFRDRHVGRLALGATAIRRPVNFSQVRMADLVGLLAPYDEDPDDFRGWARRLLARPPVAYSLAMDRRTVLAVFYEK